MNYSSEGGNSGLPENHSAQSLHDKATKQIRKYFDALVDHQLGEYYEVPDPTVLFNDDTQTLEVVVGADELEDALMKLWFVADARAQAQKENYHSAGVPASYEVIKGSHRRLHLPKPARIFTVLPANEYDSPYERMRSLRRTHDDKEVIGGYGIHYAAEVLVGGILLVEPEFTAIHPDEDVQELVKKAFLNRND